MHLLQQLPVEILSRIISLIPKAAQGGPHGPPSCLTSKEEKRDLFNLCLVSRQLRDVAQPFLFRYLDISHSDDAEFLTKRDKRIETHLQTLIRFTKALYLSPDLGQHVRFISVETEIRPRMRDITALGPDIHTVLERAVSDLPLNNEEKKGWKNALKKCDISILLALVVHKAPNLRVVRLPIGHHILERFILLRKSDPSVLASLEQFHITLDDPDYSGYNIAKYDPLFRLPSLREINFDEGNLYGKNCPSTWKPGTLNTEELGFTHCHCDISGIKKLVNACKKVTAFTFQTFAVHADSFAERGPGPHEPNAGDIHAALLPHKETLGLLQLDFWREADLVGTVEGYHQFCTSRVKLPSLRDFPVLTTVEIQHALLPEHPQFSPGLERLHITDCNSSIRNMVANIANDCKNGRYPHFVYFRVSAFDITRPIKLPGQRIPQGQTPEQCFRSLAALFEGTSVDFQIVPYNRDLMLENYSDSEGDDFPFPPPFMDANGPDIPAMMAMMQQAMQNPALAAALFAPGGDSDNSWETDDED
ncbi:hypothetical protein BJX63DRAFT_434350 [Aspergillus granulosus]|uniref:F-box domain-containing protein n=1 Tax=Aspergillus granulosus TaxID=176169 RepID=A0ABR4H4X8_9EURO